MTMPSLRLAAIPLVLVSAIGWAALRPAADADPSWNAATPHPDRIVLTWSGDPATTQSVTWRTDTTVTSAAAQVALASPGPGFGAGAATVRAITERLDARVVPDAGVRVSYHSATFTGLRPDTLYAYRVGDGERWSEWIQFRTASRERKPFSFIYVGDAQNDILSLWSRVIRQGYAAAPDARFIIHAGDLVNRANADREWGEWFRAGGFIHAMVPSVPAPGNHEYRPRSREEEARQERHLSVFWRPQFTLPRNGITGQEEASYWFDYQGARVVVLNSNEQREAQAAWMDMVLRDNPQPWTIVTFHHPVFSSGKERDNAELRAAWKPVFDRHGVDLVLQGHDHTYARGRTRVDGTPAADARANGTYASDRNVATGANARDAETGTVYVVSVSGRKMYEFKKELWDSYDVTLDRRAENTQLFQVIRIDGDTLRYRAHTATGGLYDAFDLIRRDRGANRFVEHTRRDDATRTFADPPAYKF
jgi:hypothetical protein